MISLIRQVHSIKYDQETHVYMRVYMVLKNNNEKKCEVDLCFNCIKAMNKLTDDSQRTPFNTGKQKF